MIQQLTHVDSAGIIHMVDVGDKSDTDRVAVARGYVTMSSETVALVEAGAIKKGEVLTVAKIAGILGAKQTSNLIPLCHPLPLTHVELRCTPNTATNRVEIEATARTRGKTGVEMEALTAVSIAALTIYDMAKAVDKGMRIEQVRLVYKSGGKSGTFQADEYE